MTPLLQSRGLVPCDPFAWMLQSEPKFRAYSDLPSKQALDLLGSTPGNVKRRSRADGITKAIFAVLDALPVGTEFTDKSIHGLVPGAADETCYKARLKYVKTGKARLIKRAFSEGRNPAVYLRVAG